MNRRAFFGRVLGGFAAALAGPVLLEALPAPALAFRPDAFSSFEFVEHYYQIGAGPVTRFDVIYGVGALSTPCRGSFAAYLDADRAIQERKA